MRRIEMADDAAPIGTIFDPLRQFQLSQTQACANPSTFLAFALAKVTYLGDCLDGRILSFPLLGLPAPQACVHSIVGNEYIVVPVSLGAGSFCTLSVHTGASVLAFFEQLEQRCGTPRSFRHLLRMGWIVCFINDRVVGDVAAANAFKFADSVRFERTPDLERRESPARLDDVVPARLHHSPAVVIHRPGSAPLPLPADTPLGDALETYLHECGLLHTTGSLRQTNPTHSQVGDERHHLVLTFQEAQAALDWMIVDLQHVAHPPLALYWTAPFRLPFSTPDFAEVLASEFPSLPVVVGSFIADADLELPSAIQQALSSRLLGYPLMTSSACRELLLPQQPRLQPSPPPNPYLRRRADMVRLLFPTHRGSLGGVPRALPPAQLHYLLLRLASQVPNLPKHSLWPFSTPFCTLHCAASPRRHLLPRPWQQF